MRLIALLSLVFLCLLASPSRGQSYTFSSSVMSYGYYNGSNCLYLASEWMYNNSGTGAYQWATDCIRFELSVTKYNSASDYPNNPLSTNLVTYTTGTGEWMIEQWNPTTARLSGAKYIQLQQGFVYALSLQPKAYGNYKPSYYGSWNPFIWTGQSQTLTVDVTNPGDG